MKNMCSLCPKKDFCSSLCPEASLYADQDHVNLKEKTIGTPMFAKRQDTVKLTKKEAMIWRMFINGHSRKKISETLSISRASLRLHIHNILKKL